MRAMTERRRRRRELDEGGRLLLFFGARSERELPYFGPLMSLPRDFMDINLAYSRVPGAPRRYVQDALRERAADLAPLLRDGQTHLYVCGLKGMEAGVLEALRDIAAAEGLDWPVLWRELKALLQQAGLEVCAADRLSRDDLSWLESWFMERVFPVLTPLAVDPAHPFPFIPNMGLVTALLLLREEDGQAMRALIPLPSQVERFIRLPPHAAHGRSSHRAPSKPSAKMTSDVVTLATCISSGGDLPYPGCPASDESLFQSS